MKRFSERSLNIRAKNNRSNFIERKGADGVMDKKDKYAAYIPVRGGSKSIPLKNIKPINGKPLVHWTIEAAMNCPSIDRVYVGTDSDAIREKVEEYKTGHGDGGKLFCIDRAPHTVTDTASTESAMLDFAGKYDFEEIVLIQATSPLLRAEHLTEAIAKYEDERDDSMLSVVEQKRFIWNNTPEGARSVNYDYRQRPRRQEFDGYLVENGAFYITSKERLLETECRLSGKIGLYEMEEETYFEIDEPSDWKVIEQLMGKKGQMQAPHKDIRLFAMDCDGCLTDGGMYYSNSGDELKKFNTLDGMGIGLLHKQGIKTAIITGEKNDIVKNRADKLGIKYVYMGVQNKLEVLRDILRDMNITLDQTAYIGDDINDVEVLQQAGLSFSVPNARPEAKNAAAVLLNAEGGKGAVREAAEYILAGRRQERL